MCYTTTTEIGEQCLNNWIWTPTAFFSSVLLYYCIVLNMSSIHVWFRKGDPHCPNPRPALAPIEYRNGKWKRILILWCCEAKLLHAPLLLSSSLAPNGWGQTDVQFWLAIHMYLHLSSASASSFGSRERHRHTGGGMAGAFEPSGAECGTEQ